MQGRNGKGCKESRIITYLAIPNTKDRADMELEQQAFETPEAVHRYREADLYLKRTAQRQFEKNHTRQQFREIFGKSCLE